MGVAGTYYLYAPAQRKVLAAGHVAKEGDVWKFSADTTSDSIEFYFVPDWPPPRSP